MPKKPTNQQQFLAENAELRARLNEAEETLRAIRDGETDALVVSGPEGDKIIDLKGGQEPYRIMVEAMNDGAVTLAEDGTILFANRRFADWVKVPPGQIVGQPLRGMLAEQHRQGFDAMLVQGAKGNVRETLTLQATDGMQIPTLFSMSPLPQSEGKAISVVIADLSEVIAANEARSRLALIVESSDDAIISTSLDGMVASWNRAAEKLFGYTAGEAIGQPINDLIIPPKSVSEMMRELETIRLGKRSLLEDTVRLRKDGTELDVSIKASPILDDAGEVVGDSINARDITGRKKAERLIEETGRMAHVGGWELDLEPMTVIWTDEVSRIHEVPMGYAPDLSEAIDFYSPEDRPVIQQAVQRAIDFGEPYNVEVQFITAKGNHRWVQAIGKPELKDGKTVRLSGTFQDITERKQVEQERNRATDLLGERLKELGCLYTVSTIIADSELPIEQRMQRIVEAIPPAFRYPDITCARLSLRGKQYRSDNFRKTARRLASNIALDGEEDGVLEVFYTKKSLASDEESFLREERDLVDTIARMVVDYLRLGQAMSQLQQFRDLLDDSNDSVFVADFGTARILDVNKRACTSLGYSRNELLRMKVMDIDHGVPSKSAWDSTVKAVKKTGAMLLQVDYRRKDGGTFPVEISGKYVSRSGDNYIVAIARDITERRQAETALRESEKEFHSLAESMPQIVWITRPDGWNIYFNQQWMDYTGLTPEESMGHGWNKPFHPDDQQRAWDAWQNATKNLATYSIEARLRRADGEYRWWLVRGVPLQDADGNILKWFGTCTDIHELKMAELEITRANNELQESKRRFTNMLDNVELISIMLDRDSRITYCNDHLLLLTGWQREEVMGKNWWAILVPPDLGYLEDTFFKNLLNEQAETLHHENDIITRSGERRLIHWNNSVLHSTTGEVTGIASIGEDITDRKRAELELLHREAELAESQRITRIGSWEFTPATGAHEWSAGLNLILARDIDSPAPTIEDAHQFYTPESWQRVSAAIAVTIDTGAPYDLELEMIDANGAVLCASTRGEVVRGTDETVVMLHGTVQDISDRKKAEASIRYLNRVLSVLSGINTLIVHVSEREELFREACNIAIDAGGFRMAMIVIVDPDTMLPTSIASAGKDEKLLAAIKGVLSSSEVMQTKSLVAQAMKEKKSVIANDTQNDPRLLFGKQYAEAGVNSMLALPLIISGEAVGTLVLYASEIDFFHEDEMTLLTELAGDIAYAIDHIDKQERLNYLAYYDVLTGLANRTLFFDRVAQYMQSAISGSHKLALGIIDLERFKNINDSLGRPAGDSLLKQASEWLTQFARNANLLARIDADHFAFVVPEVKSEGSLANLVENLMATFLVHSFDLNDASFRIGIKVGIALFPNDGDNVDIVFRNAEAALKKAKASGDRYLFYTQKMTSAVASKLALENQLRSAIDNEEFVLHYQPKVNLMSGKVTSAEALIRWNDPLTGLVPPGMFIPILEETGLIYEVGRWALHKAMSDYLRWRAAGLPAVRIAVNVSPLQLRNINFIDEIRQVVAVDAAAATGLELELTESLIMEDVEHSITSLQTVRVLGVTIAIDDFGTGFSSLSYLAKLPVDTLKIDRAFVIEMDKPEGMALVSTIIVMAHALKLKVVAEGVETEQQMRQLLSLNCDEMQGFLFSKPVPEDIFEANFLAPPALDEQT